MCFSPFQQFFKSVFQRNSLEKIQTKLLSDDEKSSEKFNVKLFKNGLLADVVSELSDASKQKKIMKTIITLLETREDRTKEIFDIVYPEMDCTAFRDDCLMEVLTVLNVFLFEFRKLSIGDINRILVFVANLVRFIDSVYDSDRYDDPNDPNAEERRMAAKMDHLIKVYFGLQYVGFYSTCAVVRQRSLEIFNDVLTKIHSQIHNLETVFYFDQKKTFLRIMMTYRGDPVFSSFDGRISKFYFALIARMITHPIELPSHKRNEIIRWAEGNLLSVFYSIKADKLPVLAKKEYLEALCSICTNKTENDNIVLALRSIKKIIEICPDLCGYYVRKFFEKKNIRLEKVLKLACEGEIKDCLRKKNVWEIRQLLTTNFEFKKNLLKDRNFTNVTFVFE